MSTTTTVVTPVYGGYHPNDLGYSWFSNFRVDSPRVIRFFNSVAGKMAKLVHGVNRGELIFRTSDGGFSLQALRVRVGLAMVVKAWRNDNELAHADILRGEHVIGVEGTITEDTDEWLLSSWMALQQLVSTVGLINITFPTFNELLYSEALTESGSPPVFLEYSGTGESVSYEEPSYSSEPGDLPSFRTDA